MHSDKKRFYAVLGIEPTASDEAIRLSFRHRAKELHPDAPSGDADAFILLKRAYDTLSDPEQRAAYDRLCQPPIPSAEAPRWTPPPPPPSPAAPAWTAPPSVARTRATRPPSRRRSGMGFMRYAIAFVVMAAIALGGVQAMISFTAPPASSIKTRDVPSGSRSEATASAPVADAPLPPGSSKSGFWDPTPARAPAAKP